MKKTIRIIIVTAVLCAAFFLLSANAFADIYYPKVGDTLSLPTSQREPVSIKVTSNAAAAEGAYSTKTTSGSGTGYTYYDTELTFLKAARYILEVTRYWINSANGMLNSTINTYEIYCGDCGVLISFSANGGSFTVDGKQQNSIAYELPVNSTSVFPELNPKKDGYTFGGWYENDNPGKVYADKSAFSTNRNKIYLAKWNPRSYTITFDSAGGTAVAPITEDYGSHVRQPDNPRKEGYTFAGWDPAFPSSMPADNLTLTAKWTPADYTITFDTDGGSAVQPITAPYGSSVKEPAAPTKAGYTFDGWDKAFPAAMPLNGLTLKAKWTLANYTISFNTDGGSAVKSITAPYGSAVKQPANPTKKGYTFAGWDKDFPAAMPLNGLKLTARWTKDEAADPNAGKENKDPEKPDNGQTDKPNGENNTDKPDDNPGQNNVNPDGQNQVQPDTDPKDTEPDKKDQDNPGTDDPNQGKTDNPEPVNPGTDNPDAPAEKNNSKVVFIVAAVVVICAAVVFTALKLKKNRG